MAADANALIQNLLAGTGYGHTPNDYAQQNQQIEQGNQSLQMGRMQLAAATQQEQQQQQYSRDVSDWISRGSPPAELPALAIKYPQQYQAIKAGWDLKDKAQQTADLNFFGQAYAVANNGRTDLAKQQLVARRDAEKQAGIDTSELDDLIGQFDSDPKAAANTLKSVALAHIYAGDKDGFAKAFGLGADKTHVITAGGALVDDSGKELYKAAPNPKEGWVEVKNGDGTTSWKPLPGTPGAGGPTQATAAQGGSLDPRQFYKEFILPHEGGYAAHDANGAPVNHGINQSANPGVDVKNLTGDQAADIFASKYFPASGSASLPPALAAVNADTSFINPKRAAQFLQASGGDANKYMTMRQSWMNSLVKNDPAKYAKYADAWANRNRDLSAYAAQIGGNSSTQPGSSVSGTPVGDASSGPVPANVDTLAHALVTGQQALPSSFALAKPFWQSVLTRAYQIDPLFDSSKQPARVAAVKAFTGNGKAAQTIGSVNRIANHLSDMYDASEQLVGPNLGNTGVNSLVASVGQSFQPAALRKYNTAVPLVADELEKIARNSSGSVHGIEAAIANLKAAQSTDERRAAIQEVVSLIHGAVGPLQTQWSDAFTAGIKPPTWVGSKARAVFAHLAPQLDESDIENPAAPAGKPSAAPRSAGSPSASPAAVPVHIATMAQAMALPSGTRFVDPHGVTRVRP